MTAFASVYMCDVSNLRIRVGAMVCQAVNRAIRDDLMQYVFWQQLASKRCSMERLGWE